MVIERRPAVVLFSGGIDSLACLQWAIKAYGKDNVEALYVNLGVNYTEFEVNATETLADKLNIELTCLNWKVLGSFEDRNGHVPLRNIFLLEIAYLYGWNVVFGMLKGEYSEDKNLKFIRNMQKLFNSQTKRNLYNTGNRVIIHTPFSGMTKTSTVKWMLNNGISAIDIGTTIGCLKSMRCGKCMSCFNRWVALENNGLGDLDLYLYEDHPALWGVDQVIGTSKAFKDASKNVSFWGKRAWLKDVWKAYDSVHKRKVLNIHPRDIMKSYVGL